MTPIEQELAGELTSALAKAESLLRANDQLQAELDTLRREAIGRSVAETLRATVAEIAGRVPAPVSTEPDPVVERLMASYEELLGDHQRLLERVAKGNPNHKGSGEGGGQFASSPGGGGGDAGHGKNSAKRQRQKGRQKRKVRKPGEASAATARPSKRSPKPVAAKEPVGAGKPIAERIAMDGPHAEKHAALLKIHDELRAADRTHKALAKEFGERLDRGEYSPELHARMVDAQAEHDWLKVTARRKADEVLDLPKGQQSKFRHQHDGEHWDDGMIARTHEASHWLTSKLAKPEGSGNAMEIGWAAAPGARAFALTEKSRIMIGTRDDNGVMVHEMGHLIEHHYPGAKEAAQEFLEHRVGDEPTRSMNELTKSRAYKDDEIGREDEFRKAFGGDAGYVGKHYADGETEILSMGLQKLHDDPVGFAKKDPEFSRLILGILDGSLRHKSK